MFACTRARAGVEHLVDRPPVTNPQDKYEQPILNHLDDQSEVANPESTVWYAYETAERRVGIGFYSLNALEYPLRNGTV